MVDEVGAAQARELLKELHIQLADISRKLEAMEQRHRRTSVRGAMADQRQLTSLRRELYEMHRLIGGLHSRFPETVQFSYPEVRDAAQASRPNPGGDRDRAVATTRLAGVVTHDRHVRPAAECRREWNGRRNTPTAR